MSVAWRKAWRDLWDARARSALVALAIALGISAFAAVLSTYAILTRELDHGYLATNPASASFTLDDVDDASIDDLRAAGIGVADAEARRATSARVRTGPIEWKPLRLFVVKDFGDVRISRVEPQAGAWPPATGDLLLERDAFQVAGVRIGDTVSVRMRGGEEHSLRVTGSVHDVGQAQARMEQIVYGYVTSATLAQLGAEPRFDQLLIVADRPSDEARVREVAAAVQRWLEARGHDVRDIDVPAPGQHPHSKIMGMLLLAQSAFGLVALALSGLLVVNLVTALLASQSRQIGVMRTLGGRPWKIARIYLAQVFLLGVVALALAIPAGIGGGLVLSRLMATLLNFDLESLAIPAWVLLLEIGVGLAVPLLAALAPIWRASRVSIREALADAGADGGAGFGAHRIDRAIARIGGATRPVLLAVRNGFRRRGRWMRTVATLAVAGWFFLVAVDVRSSLIRRFDRYFDTARHDLSVEFAGMVPFAQVERAAKETAGVSSCEGWITTTGSFEETGGAADATSRKGAPLPGDATHAATASSLGGHHASSATDAERFSVVGVPEVSRLFAPDLVDGRSFATDDVDVVVLNSKLAARLSQARAGGSVTFRVGTHVQSWRVVGIASEPIFAGAVAYVPSRLFERGGHAGTTNSARIALASPSREAVAAARADLEKRLEQEGLRPSSSSTRLERRRSVDEHMKMIYVFLVLVSGLLLGVGTLGLLTTMTLNVLERRRELGILRTLGATPAAIACIVVGEGVTLGLLAWAIATVVAAPTGLLLTRFIGSALFDRLPPFVFDPAPVAAWLGISLGVATLGSLVPAWQASRRSIREAVACE